MVVLGRNNLEGVFATARMGGKAKNIRGSDREAGEEDTDEGIMWVDGRFRAESLVMEIEGTRERKR